MSNAKALNCLHMPRDNSTRARLEAVIAMDKSTCSFLRREIFEKRQDIEDTRLHRRWAESKLRLHLAGKFELPEVKSNDE